MAPNIVLILTSIPFFLVNFQAAFSYIYKSQVTAASIWHSDFSSLYEKYLYYLTGPGSFILKPYNPFLLLTAVFVIAFILFINPSNLSPIVKSLRPIKFDVFSSVFLLSLTTSLPYFLLATDTNHKTVFLGSFIGISISLWFTFIVVYLFSIILKNISVSKSSLDYSYFKYYKPSLIAIISLLIYASASSYTFEYIYWGRDTPEILSLTRSFIVQLLIRLLTIICKSVTKSFVQVINAMLV